MGTSDVIAAGSGLLSLVAIVVSVLVARSQSRLARREQLLPVVSEILRESVTPEFRSNRNYIVDRMATDHPLHADGMRGLPPDVSNRARHVMSYMNNVGLLVANESISAQMVSSVMGGSVVNVWNAAAPYVYAERLLRGDDPNYYGYLENLAVIVHEIGPDELATKLKLRKCAAGPGTPGNCLQPLPDFQDKLCASAPARCQRRMVVVEVERGSP